MDESSQYVQSAESDLEPPKHFVCGSALSLTPRTISMNKYIVCGVLNLGIHVLCWQAIFWSFQAKLNCRVLLKQVLIAMQISPYLSLWVGRASPSLDLM